MRPRIAAAIRHSANSAANFAASAPRLDDTPSTFAPSPARCSASAASRTRYARQQRRAGAEQLEERVGSQQGIPCREREVRTRQPAERDSQRRMEHHKRRVAHPSRLRAQRARETSRAPTGLRLASSRPGLARLRARLRPGHQAASRFENHVAPAHAERGEQHRGHDDADHGLPSERAERLARLKRHAGRRHAQERRHGAERRRRRETRTTRPTSTGRYPRPAATKPESRCRRACRTARSARAPREPSTNSRASDGRRGQPLGKTGASAPIAPERRRTDQHRRGSQRTPARARSTPSPTTCAPGATEAPSTERSFCRASRFATETQMSAMATGIMSTYQ